MTYPFDLPGTPPLKARLQPGTFSGFKLFVEGKEIPQSREPGKVFLVPLAGGGTMRVEIKPNGLQFIPKVVADGKEILLAPPLPGWQIGLALLPAILVFVGGVIGGAIGGAAVMVNLWILRGKGSLTTRILLVVGVTVVATVVWMVIIGLLQGLIRG